MRKLDVAMAMICQVDKYHLQHRIGDKRIGAAGLIGCFGGKVEGDEDSRQTAIRELEQETNISLDSESFKQLRIIDSVVVVSDYNLQPVEVHADVVEVLLPHGQPVEAKEGELVTWVRKDILNNMEELTPATREFFGRYFR